MKELIDFIKEVEKNIKVDEDNGIEPFINAYYVSERIKLIIANLVIENGTKEISNKQN